MPFEELIAEITRAHGPTSYQRSSGGGAQHVALGPSRHRDNTFKIYNYAAFGTRTTAAPRTAAATRYRIRVRTPTNTLLEWHAGDGRYLEIARERTYPRDKVMVFRDSTGLTVMQVTHAGLFLLFDIEQVEGGEQLLRQIYETWVLPLGVARESQEMFAFQAAGVQAVPSPGVVPSQAQAGVSAPRVAPASLPPREPPGKGRDWDYFRKTLSRPPAVSDIKGLVSRVKATRLRNRDQLTKRAEVALEAASKDYQDKLRTLNGAKQKMWDAEDALAGLRTMAQAGVVPDDEPEILALTSVVGDWYEKVWEDSGVFWGLTKPITIRYREGEQRRNDDSKLRVAAGRFIVKVPVDTGTVEYYREDGRVAMGGRGQAVAPHCLRGTDICWGTYRGLLTDCQQKGDYTQLLLLVAQHLGSCTPGDSYCDLREYARLLHLPEVDEALAAAMAEMNAGGAVTDPSLAARLDQVQGAANVPQPPSRVEAVEITAEELDELGLDTMMAGASRRR